MTETKTIKETENNKLEQDIRIKDLEQKLTEKDQIIEFLKEREEEDKQKLSKFIDENVDLEQKLKDLEKQNNNLDYLLNSGRNKHEHERIKRLKELETKLNQPLTSQELLFTLLEKLESNELTFCFEDEDNKLYLEESENEGARIYLFSLGIGDNDIEVFGESGKVWEEVNEKYKEKFLKDNIKLEENKEVFQNQEKNNSKLTKIQGILTSNLRSRTSTDVPYMAFFRSESANKHSLEECEAFWCKDCEIPVIFRIDSKEFFTPKWIKPNLKKGDNVILEGEFGQSKDSNRPSFTCYSYQIINDHE